MRLGISIHILHKLDRVQNREVGGSLSSSGITGDCDNDGDRSTVVSLKDVTLELLPYLVIEITSGTLLYRS